MAKRANLTKRETPRRAIVLSGGGARGAYEAGVLRFLFEDLPTRLGHAPRIDLVSGTSVGAIHACFVAATMHEGTERGAQLGEVWESMALSEMFGSAIGELLRVPRRMYSILRARGELREGATPDRLYGLLNSEHLERIVREAIPWSRIRRNLGEGNLEAVSVAATEIATGRATVFLDAQRGPDAAWDHDPSMIAQPVRLGPAHALASAAIPLLFPAVRVGNTYYADGGLRVNTPLAPVLRLGADRVLVIALRRGATGGAEGDLAAKRVGSYGNPLFLLGKVLNALLLDHIDNDLAHMRMLNDVVRGVSKVGGEGALERVNEALVAERGHAMRVIQDLVVRPSQDVGLVAAEAMRGIGGPRPSAGVRLLVRAFDLGEESFEADLLSYVLFDHSFTRRLVALGYEDAKAQGDQLAEFFAD